LVVVFFIFFYGCDEKKNVLKENALKITLRKEVGNPKIFDSLYTNFHFESTYKEHKTFYSKELKSFQGIPSIDTSLLVTRFSDKLRFWYNLYKEDLLEDSTLIKRVETINNPDSIGYQKQIKNKLTIFSGLGEDKQIIIVDTDRDYNFGDEEILEFNRNFTNNPTKNRGDFENLPLLDYVYEFYDNEKVDVYNRKIIVYPFKNHPFTDFFEADSLNKKLHVMGKLKDYWKGRLEVSKQTYNILLQGFNKKYVQILIVPDSIELDQNDYIKNKKFEYFQKDTFSLSDKLFVIEDFSLKNSELKIKELENVHPYCGFRENEIIDNLNFTDLKRKEFNLSNARTNKKYVLLDFWGTWCPPCLETTPLLKDIYANHSNELEVVGVAYDKNEEVVHEYTSNNELNWPQAFIKNKDYSKSLLKKLRIQYYPTFLLIDNEDRIIKREIGMEGLLEIRTFLSKNLK